jgi:hypothetical protein
MQLRRNARTIALKIDIWKDARACGRANHVGVSNLQAGKSVAIRVGGEIAGAHGQRRNQPGEGKCMELIFLLAIDKQKRLVLLDRPAHRPAKLVQVELFRGGGKVALGI